MIDAMVDKREITPELLARITVLLFQNIRVKAILQEQLRFDRLSAENIAQLMMKDEYFYRAQSEEGCKSLAHSVIDYVTRKTDWQNKSHETFDNHYLNIWDLVMLTIQDLLTMNQNQLQCRYEEISSWRLLVRHLGEELLVAARYAQWDYEHHKAPRNRYDDFAWPYVTRHNNKQLNMLVERGISDHHCHLWGSTPYFHVSWVNLMNNVTNSSYQANLQNLDSVVLSDNPRQKYSPQLDDSAVAKLHRNELHQARAAWIRLYLCERLDKQSEKNAVFRYHDLELVRHYSYWRKLLLSRDRLQHELDFYLRMIPNSCDYALSFAKLRRPEFSEDYHMLIGERWLYYQIFWDYCQPSHQRKLTYEDYNLFFVYFLVRLHIRSNMVQNNDYIGFDNFQTIQNRKADYLGDTESERALTRLTINDSLHNKPYMKELEVRIGPDKEQVRCVEEIVNSDGRNDRVERFIQSRSNRQHENQRYNKTDLRDRYYFVFHFIKRPDPNLDADVAYRRIEKVGLVCRHAKQRQRYLAQARDIVRFRETEPQLARRVLGIDAASAETECRPEVFGTVYRLLGDHQFSYGGYLSETLKLPSLGKTYHVGEDFADIIDGLRAIDEVVNFLDFDCGDRIGHAIVLGVNVEDWYEQKNREISVSVQNYLDNLAWFYHALTRYAPPDCGALKERIVRDFEYWFRIVYRNSISDDEIRRLMGRAREDWYSKTNEDHARYHEHICHFDIITYYRSWMLRGDDPSCYVDGYFKKPAKSSLLIPEERAKVCPKFPPRHEDRYIPEYSLLNYLYQYNEHVRREGSRRIKVDISSDYIRAAKAIQVEMRYRIMKKGISIETNPTSNVLIGTFRRYDKHPIISFYNRGLPVTEKEERECAQMQVSINTDDSGVFYTNLETEYALLARSVEQITGEGDNQRFKKADIYTWLDNIRIMGNEQSFRNSEDNID